MVNTFEDDVSDAPSSMELKRAVSCPAAYAGTNHTIEESSNYAGTNERVEESPGADAEHEEEINDVPPHTNVNENALADTWSWTAGNPTQILWVAVPAVPSGMGDSSQQPMLVPVMVPMQATLQPSIHSVAAGWGQNPGAMQMQVPMQATLQPGICSLAAGWGQNPGAMQMQHIGMSGLNQSQQAESLMCSQETVLGLGQGPQTVQKAPGQTMPGPGPHVGSISEPHEPRPWQQLEVERMASGNTEVVRVAWTVDARKLRSNDKEAVSPGFVLKLKKDAQFKMVLRPKVVNGQKGGACFKKAEGRGSVWLRCLDEVDKADSPVVCFSIWVGPQLQERESARGPVTHNFSDRALSGLSEEYAEWEFPKYVNKRAGTFVVCLEASSFAG